MWRSVVAKGKNLQEAVDTALDLLKAKQSEVDVEIVEMHTKGFMGMGAKPAVVKVSLKVPDAEHGERPPERKASERTALAQPLAEGSEGSGEAARTANVVEEQDKWRDCIGKAWVQNGAILFQTSAEAYPVVFPGKGVKLYLNDELTEEAVVIAEGDRLHAEVEDTVHDPQWEIAMSEDQMKVTMTVTQPGRRIFRALKEKEPCAYLELETEERAETVAVEEALVLEALRSMGVIFGIRYADISKACASGQAGSFVIAEGNEATRGSNGHFKLAKDVDVKKGLKEREDGTVDYKELQEFPSIERGQIIGVVVPPKPGIPGTTVTGHPVLPEELHPITVQVRRGAMLIDGNKVAATEPGSPEVNWKGQLAVVSIVPKLVLNHDVTLETGNIHFVGQIELHGSVQDGMAVDANESLTVYGNV